MRRVMTLVLTLAFLLNVGLRFSALTVLCHPVTGLVHIDGPWQQCFRHSVDLTPRATAKGFAGARPCTDQTLFADFNDTFSEQADDMQAKMKLPLHLICSAFPTASHRVPGGRFDVRNEPTPPDHRLTILKTVVLVI